jgi:multiple antibiotic resistance protein
MCVSLIIFLFGSFIMRLFGITVDAFRAGSGVLLMLTAIAAVNRQPSDAQKTFKFDKIQELALVPMAVPMTAGPAVLGTLMVEGTDAKTMLDKLAIILAIILATSSIGVCLIFADKIEALLGHSRIIILSKLTGLILSAIAVQMIVVGVKSLFFATP